MGDSFDKFLAIPTSQKVAVLVVIMALVGAGWYSLFFEATQAAIEAETKAQSALAAEKNQYKGIEKNLAKQKAELEELERRHNEMRDKLPNDAQIADLLEQIHGRAKIVGLEISRFENQPVEREQGYFRIPINMKLKGTFHQVEAFFRQLAQLKRIVNVENISLQVDRSGDEPMLTVGCNATTFMYASGKEG